MKERPILFSAPMVRALLAGTKTQTRRIVKPQPPNGHAWAGWCVTSTHRADEGKATWAAGTGPFLRDVHRVACPYGQPGDRMWVRETFVTGYEMDPSGYFKTDEAGEYIDKVWYRATDPDLEWWVDDVICEPKWRPSIFMPRALSRLTLEVVSVRVERLQDISEGDAVTEGVERHLDGWYPYGIRTILTTLVGGVEVPAQFCRTARDSYRMLWESINGAGSWNANPYVWVIEFKRIDAQECMKLVAIQDED